MRTVIVMGPEYMVDLFADGSVTIYHIGLDANQCVGCGQFKDGHITDVVTPYEGVPGVLDGPSLARIEKALMSNEGGTE